MGTFTHAIAEKNLRNTLCRATMKYNNGAGEKHTVQLTETGIAYALKVWAQDGKPEITPAYAQELFELSAYKQRAMHVKGVK